jgi:hypothetical protein
MNKYFFAFCVMVGLVSIPTSVLSQRLIVEKPSTCEHLKNRLDYSLIESGKSPSAYLIMIFRPGRSERSAKPSEARPAIITQYIKKRDPGFNNLVVAQSRSASELGKLEIYIGGNLWSELFFRRNESGSTQCIE